MADEEATLVVDEKFVEYRRDLFVDAEPLGGQCNSPLERGLPVLATDVHAIRLDLPCSPHLGVDDRLFAAPGRRTVPSSAAKSSQMPAIAIFSAPPSIRT